MIPGFNSNTSISFPMITELQLKINDYIKITCQDIFFDLLQPELDFKRLLKFFYNILSKFNDIISQYFYPLESRIKSIVVLDGNLFNPIDNVLRKTYQSNYIKISAAIEKNYINYISLAKEIQTELNINSNSIDIIKKFCEETYNIVFLCHICQPKIYIDLKQIGKEVLYNASTHDALDGFIKYAQKCIIILPAFYKGYPFSKDNIIVKSQVLACNYG